MKFDWIQKHDWIISGIIVVLLTLSSILVYSTTYNTEDVSQGAGSFPKQIAFITIGIIIYFAIIYFDIEWLRHKQVLAVVYGLLIFSLLYLVVFGQEIAGTQRWIQIGFINIQPSEYAKILIILLTSMLLGNLKNGLDESFKEGFLSQVVSRIKEKVSIIEKIPDATFVYLSSGLLISPIIFLVFIQPALGNALILSFIWMMIIFISFTNQSKIIMFIIVGLGTTNALYKLFTLENLYSKVNLEVIRNGFDFGLIILTISLFLMFLVYWKMNIKIFLLGVILGIVVFPVMNWSWNNLVADYQKQRVESFMEGAESDRFGAGYQVTQSKIAIGSGKIWGKGYLQGSQSSLKVLDFAYTDFIFAAYSEQFGFSGAVFLLLIYLILLLRIIQISININDHFYSLICIGIATMLLLNIFINIGMNMGILPVTGVPLPLISYGGNSVIVNLIGLGIVQSIYYRTRGSLTNIAERNTEVFSSSSIDWNNLPIR